LTPNYICYVLLDEITDLFVPINKLIRDDIDNIDESVALLKASEQSEMLERISQGRKRVMIVSRLMNSKPELIKVVITRMIAESKEMSIFLEDIYDHAITMKQDFIVYEKALLRTHSNYLAQINIELTKLSNRGNQIVTKLTVIASAMYPMVVITSIFGMNVNIPGGTSEGLGWFFGIFVFMVAVSVLCLFVIHRYLN
jgi:magnesium transporter